MPLQNSPSFNETGLLFKPDVKGGREGILTSCTQTVFDLSYSDLAVWYSFQKSELKRLQFQAKTILGIYDVPEQISSELEWVDFLLESGEILIRNQNNHTFLKEILFHEKMNSGIVLPLFNKGIVSDIVILNSRNLNHYGKSKYRDLYSIIEICSNLL